VFISPLKPSGFYIYHQVVHLKILVSAYNISVLLYCSTKQDTQRTYNVIFRRVRVTNVAVEKQ